MRVPNPYWRNLRIRADPILTPLRAKIGTFSIYAVAVD